MLLCASKKGVSEKTPQPSYRTSKVEILPFWGKNGPFEAKMSPFRDF
jgi:hypothetical protein